MKIDHALVNAHLESIPGLGTFTARGLPGGDAKSLSGHADRALDLKILLLSSTDEVAADLLEALNIPRGESDADAMDWALITGGLGCVLKHRHDVLLIENMNL